MDNDLFLDAVRQDLNQEEKFSLFMDFVTNYLPKLTNAKNACLISPNIILFYIKHFVNIQ